MGYHTYFSGCFNITPELKPEHRAYLTKFAEIRHMKRNPDLLQDRPDPERIAVGLPLGADAEFFVGSSRYDESAYNREDKSVLDVNRPGGDCPGLWCQWVPSEDGDSTLVWDEGEKFYDYVEWLEYLVEKLLKPWGYTIEGECRYDGEDSDDKGYIYAKDNMVEAVQDINPGPSWGKDANA